MQIEQAAMKQLDEILLLYEQARAFMAANGNPTQWVNGYPDASLVRGDILAGDQYVCTENGRILAAFYFSQKEEPAYRTLVDGSWLDPGPCAVVHRICVAEHGCGVARFCLDWCFDRFPHLRMDTHRDNRPMQALLAKCGFQRCGSIFLEDGSHRLAYEKVKG